MVLIVEVRHLVKRYQDTLVVDHLDLVIPEGVVFGLLGPNGAGKTTTIGMLTGMTAKDGGSVRIFGQNIETDELEIKRQIGLVPQEIAVFEDLTVLENLRYFGRLYGLRVRALQERIEETLAFVGLTERGREYPKTFSGGLKRRLNIACAIVHQPRLLILDEPTVGIDPQSRHHILESLKELNRRGSTILYTSHYMEEVAEICTDICILDHGRVLARGTQDELKALVTQEEKVVIELPLVNYTMLESISRIHGVKDCMVEGRTLTVLSARNSQNLSRLIDCMTETGTEILSLQVVKPTLESVFLALTGRSLRD